ncbi:MAG: hypothetical protein BWY82_00850 [Verrucomicrobia bacterium ADurb.Bin474]|nr:MAG: hypothetical protein BWY82_00850 [Verrucomicrobia bacterium ADurb.Bin474]
MHSRQNGYRLNELQVKTDIPKLLNRQATHITLSTLPYKIIIKNRNSGAKDQRMHSTRQPLDDADNG